MNKHRYRIIFNRARRMLVVVSELARCHGGDSMRGPGVSASCTAVLRPLTLALWLAGGLVSAAQAGTITADRGAPGGQRPTVLQTGNGLPQVNIQTPNDQGLSHNKYSQFDVGERGAVLNNSQHSTQTQLAGQVAGNPWLAKGSAKVILNEVNSMNPSQLHGFVEVAGKKADVIIANPAGIACSGCGFINAGHNTLAAGRVQIKNGQVAGYDVDRGRIVISGGGMDGSRQDYTHLIGRAVEVNARLQAGDLQITTGRNQTDADGNVVVVKADDAEGRPQFAVDTSSLGGMYGRRITLVGTERGVGVRNAGEIGAMQGKFTLSAQGKISNSGTLYAQQDLTLKTAQLDNQGHISSGSNLQIASQGDVTNKGTLSAEGNLQLDSSGRLHGQAGSALTAGGNATVSAKNIEADAGSAMGAGIDGSGKATRRGQLTVRAEQHLASHGTHLSGDGFIASGRDVDISASQTRAATVAVTAREGDINADDTLIDARQATLSTAHVLTTRRSAIAADRLNINAAEKIDNGGGALISRGEQGLTLNSQRIDNRGGTLASAGDFSLSSHSLDNTGGELGSENGSVAIRSDEISGAQGKIFAGGDLTLSGQQILLDSGLAQGQQVRVQATSLSMQNGKLLQTGKGEMQITTTGDLNAVEGAIESAGAIDLRAGSLDNRRGDIASNDRLRVTTGQLNNASGTLLGDRLDVHADALNNREGTLEAIRSLAITAASLDSQQGFISADGGDAELSITGEIDNRGGNLQSAKNMRLSAAQLANQDGRVLAADGKLEGEFNGSVDNRSGKLIAQQLAIRAADLNNRQGVLIADEGAASLALSGQLNNRQGTLQSQQTLTLQAASLDNNGGSVLSASAQIIGEISGALSNLAGSLLAGTSLALHAGSIDNQLGVLAATDGDSALSVAGGINNEGGDIESSQRLTLDAASVKNSQGQLLSGEAMQISTRDLTNAGGLIQSSDALDINTHGGALINADTLSDTGGIRAGGALTLSAGDVDNHNGLISGNTFVGQGLAWNNLAGEIDSLHALSLSGNSLSNGQGLISAGDDDLTVSLSRALDNQQGTMQSSRGLQITAAALNNTGGSLLAAGGSASVKVQNALTNQQGKLLAKDDLLLKADQIDNGSGQLVSTRGSLTVSAGTLNNQLGSLAAQKDVRLDGQALDNREGSITSVDGVLNARLDAGMDNQHGVLQSGDSVTLSGTSLDNRSGKVLAVAGKNQIAVRDALNNAQGQIVSGGETELHAASLVNQDGAVSSKNGALDVNVSGAIDNQRGSLEAGGAVTISSASLDNREASLLSANESLTVSTAQNLNNQQGRIAARKNVTLSTDGLDNQQGTVTAVDETLAVHAGQNLDNRDGTLQSRGDLSLDTLSLTNARGTIQSTERDGRLTIAGPLDNQSGSIVASGALTLSSGDIDNRKGVLLADSLDLSSRRLTNQAGLIQGSDSLRIDTHGQQLDNSSTSGEKTGLRSGGGLDLIAGELINRAGLIAGKLLDLNLQGLNNHAGTVSSAEGSNITSGALDNQSGAIQSGGDLRLDTQGADLQNLQGKLLADGSLAISSGSLSNQQGLIQGGAGLSVQGSHVDNQRGQLLSGADMTARVESLDNTLGLLFAAGNAQLAVRQGVENQQGLIKAGQALNLSTGQIDNQHTRGSKQGIEAQDLTLSTGSLNNQDGALRAGDTLQADVREQLNNRNGLISSQNSLTVGQPGSPLALSNAGGDIVANGDASLWLGQFDGAGRIVSGGSLGLDIASAVNQSGTLAAGNDLTLNTHGNTLTNSGALSAGNRLTLTTGQLNNQQSGDINAGTTHITASGILNQGLVDGGDVLLRTDQLHNTGTGRLYGDMLVIDARTLLNDKSGETAATIAARDALTIATNWLSNQDHGLIYSNGGLSIGGRLNAAGELTGRASQVENLSATLEAMGDLRIDAAKTENRDTHLTVSSDLKTVSVTPNVLDVELCSGEKWNEACGRTDGQHYRFKGSLIEFNQDENSPVAFDFDPDGRSYALDEQGNRISVDVDGKPQYIYLWQDSDKDIIRFNLPGVADDGRRFDIFSYTQRVKEQEVSGQDSATIRSGGDLTLTGDLHNKDSQVVAGQDLLINGSVDNDETTVRQEITQDGVVVRAGKRKSHKQTHFEGQGVYQAPTQETDLPLHLTVQQQGQGAVDGRTIAQQQSTGGAGGRASGLSGPEALAQHGQQTLVSEVPLPSGPSGDTQLKPVSDALSDGSGASDLHRQKTVDGMTDAGLTGASDLTATLAGNSGSAQAGIDDTHSGPPVTPPSEDSWVLRSVTGPVKLPDNSLFSLHPGSDSHYLVETDPRFTDGKQALSSGDFYSQDQLQKRLGDGFYEQSLVREQVVKATGQRYLSGYSDDESQYRALLSSGKSFTERFTISPGADLSAEQMAQVTADMVLMVNQTVTLPDGSTQVVSVPKLYARVHPGDLQGNGSLLAGNTVRINTADKVINSGSINGRELTDIAAGSLLNTGDISGSVTQLVATGDIVNRGGQLKGGDQLTLRAGNDILSLTDSERRGSESWLGRQAGIAVTNDGGGLSLNAGHDIQLTASALSNQGRDSSTRLIAGNDITLDTAKTAHATDYTRNSHNYDRTQESREAGSVISTGGSLLMQSGRDMNLRAADVTATGDATLLAGNNLNLTSGEAVWDQSSRAKWTKHHFLSKTTHKIESETHQQSALGSTVSGDTLKVMAGNDLTASGSNLLGTHDVTLGAGNNLALTTAAESDHAASVEQKKKSGFSGTGGIGFSLGKSSQKLTRDDSSNVQKGSVAGSSAGSLTLQAGNAATVHGSDLVAGQDLTVTGKNVSITSAENSHTALTKSESKSSGLTLGLSGTVGSALNTAVHQVKAAKKEESGRLAALKGTQAALTGYQAAQAAQLAAGAAGGSSDGNIAGLMLSYGKQKSTSEQRQEDNSASGSRLQAGRDMHIAATAGDLTVEGAQLKAGQDMALSASRDVNLTSGKNSTQSSGHSSSHGGSVGAGLAVGGGAAGLSVSAGVNQSRGHENGSSLTHTETTADAGRNLTLNSGRDALLQGAQVSGESVKADIGRNLLIASEQDRDRYDMKQTGSSVGGSVIFGAGIGGSASLSGSRDKMNSDFTSVKEQSGLFAGKGGFDISVGNHTQLDGGVIASTAEKEKNRLDTGTLGWSDIHNQADYKTEHQGAGISTGGSVGEQFVGNMANNTLVGANGSGHDSSTTHAAVEDGTIIIRDKDKQQQDIATLDRDTEHAANGLSPIFDKEKEQRRLQEAQVIGEIGSQVGDIARTQGEIAAQKVAGSKMEHATKADRDKAQRDWENANPGKTATDKDISGQLYQNFYNQAFTETGLGTGGKVQQAIQAATAAIQGLAGSDLKAAIAGGAAPYIATVIAKAIPGEGADALAARAMAHAAVNAALAKAQGNNALAGAAGAATAEMMAPAIIASLGWDQNNLSETQKQTVSALSTLAAGLAGGLAGGSTESAVSGAQAGKTTVENNALGSMAGSDLGFWLGKSPDCDINCKAKIAGGVAKGNAIVSAELAGTVGLGVVPAGAQVTAVIGSGANAIIQYTLNGKVSYTDALIAGWVGAATSNSGLLGTVGWNAAGGATSNYIKGDDPLTGAITGGAASGLGYGVGKVVQGPLDKLLNPNWKNWEWVGVGMGISKPLPLDPRPAVIGNIISSGSTEGIGQEGSKAASSSKEEAK